MKRINLYLMTILAILFGYINKSNGQATVASNFGSGVEFLGWNNNFPLIFKTNGVTNMTLQNGTGNLGIGGIPSNRLDVFAGDIDVNAPRRSYMINDKSVLWHKGGITNIFVGVGAGQNHLVTNSVFNTLIGSNAGFNLLGGANGGSNVFIGADAAFNYINHQKSVIIGREAGFNINADNATFIGYRAGYSTTQSAGTGNTFVGFESGFATLSSSNDNAFFGNNSGRNNTSGDQNTFCGNGAGLNSTTGMQNCFMGNGCGATNGTHSNNNYYGHLAGNSSVGDENVLIGTETGSQGVGNKNVVLGGSSMKVATKSHENVVAGAFVTQTGDGNNFNVLLGAQSSSALNGSDLNTLIGYKTALNQTTGLSNAYLGESTGNNILTGTNNTFIGAKADATNPGSTLINAAAIGANAKVTNSNHMILGDNNVNVGIGLSGDPTGPGNKLEINTSAALPIPGASGLRFRDLNSTSTAIINPGTGILSVDANGDVIYVNGGGAGS